MAELRRANLETRRSLFVEDNATILTWIDDDVLHLAINDYGDDPGVGIGKDIDDPRALYLWLVTDRFGKDRERLVDYCSTFGIEVGNTDDSNEIALISDWRSLTILLIRDRCEGENSWERVSKLVEEAGISATNNFRGYA